MAFMKIVSACASDLSHRVYFFILSIQIRRDEDSRGKIYRERPFCLKVKMKPEQRESLSVTPVGRTSLRPCW